MPAARREARGSGGQPPSGTRTTAAAPPPKPRKPRRRPRLRLGLIPLLLLLVLGYLVAVPLYHWTTIDKVDAEPNGARPDDQPGTNYLIVGSDKADDLSDEQRKVLKTGPRGGTNTDTIIVLHTGSGGRTMMSIPRDTLAEVPGHGTQMINAAFSLGKAPLLVASVEKLTGIHIDHYVELGFGSVINTVDAFGGVEICPKQDMVDPMARLDVKKGCQEVDGLTALAYSRSRHVTALSDLDRVARQREVISALGSEAKTPWTFVNPVRYWKINAAAAGAIRIDEGMNPVDLGRYALAMTGDSQTCTMPNLSAPSDPNRIIADPDRAKVLFNAIIEDTEVPKAACTPTGRARS
jgi:LCP family protein required for cell wall assembly